MDIPDGYKGRIIGKGGANLRVISEQTGAEVTRKRGGEVHIIKGTEKQREEVKMIIRTKVVSGSNCFFFFYGIQFKGTLSPSNFYCSIL